MIGASRATFERMAATIGPRRALARERERRRIDDLATQALNRMDTKGESLEAAAEAVTGGNRADMAAIAADLRGALL